MQKTLILPKPITEVVNVKLPLSYILNILFINVNGFAENSSLPCYFFHTDLQHTVINQAIHSIGKSYQLQIHMRHDQFQTADFHFQVRSEEHTSELQSRRHLVC